MENKSPDPDSVNPFHAAFGAKAKDPASITDAMRQADRDRERDFEFHVETRLDGMLWFPPALYFSALALGNDGVAFLSYLTWAAVTVVWVPWTIILVTWTNPPGDTAKAAAFLGYAMLGWPLSAAAIELVPVPLEFLTAFPVVFLWSMGFAVEGARPRPGPNPQPTPSRARMLAGGGLAYLACTSWLVGLVMSPRIGIRLPHPLDAVVSTLEPVILILALLLALPGVCMLPVAAKTWRETRSR